MRLLTEARNLIGNYHVKSGVYHYYRHEYNQAVEFLRKALGDQNGLSEADGKKARQYLTLSLMDAAARHAGAGELDGAVEKLRRAAEVSPEYPDIQFRLGCVLEQQGKTTEAIAAYERSVTANRRFVDGWIALGFCRLAADRDDAAAAFQEALRLRVREIEKPCREGIEQLAAGAREEARERFHHAFRAIPELAHEIVKKGLDRLRSDEHEEALLQFERAVSLNPKYPDLHNYRGVTLCELGRLDEAIEAFRLSARLSPRYLVPRLNLAFALVRAERYREAEVELEEILRQDPTETVAKAQLEALRSGQPTDSRRLVHRGR